MQEISRVTGNKLLRPGEGRRKERREEGRARGYCEQQIVVRADFCKVTDMKGLLHTLRVGPKDGGR